MADALGERPGHELVDVAQRFVAGARALAHLAPRPVEPSCGPPYAGAALV